MQKKDIIKAVKELEDKSQKRKFKQSYDLSMAFRELDLKNPDNRIELYLVLPHKPREKTKICAFVDQQHVNEAKKICDTVIEKKEFSNWKTRDMKRLVRGHDFFIAQSNIMPGMASVFGKFLSVLGKMPSPKSKTIFGPGDKMESMVERLGKTVKILAKKQPVINCKVGEEGYEPEKIADNVMFIFNEIIHNVPEGERQIKNMYLKLTMSKPVKLW